MTALIQNMRSLISDESGKTLSDDNDQIIEDFVTFEKFLI